jgi:hypothetical protein
LLARAQFLPGDITLENILTTPDLLESLRLPRPGEANSSGVSWGAVIGGAFVAAAFYLILLALGAGLGLSSVSPWSWEGVSASAVRSGAIIWLIFIEIIASALGGYLTGRLRTKWTLVHTDEIFFRDTANGFLSWAVALVITIGFLASATVSMVGNIRANAARDTGGQSTINVNAYYIDASFRADQPTPNADLSRRAEAGRILTAALAKNEISSQDRTYLAQLIATTTGISVADADKRISDVMTEALSAEDIARKATARLLLWFFLSLLMGAFSASYAATVGGRQRDHVKPV